MTFRRALVPLALIAAALGALALRVSLEGRGALTDGDTAFTRGDTADAIADWEAAARWYLPGAPHVADAYARLAQLAAQAEGQHDRAHALAAWTAIRSAALATRGAWSPFAAERADADAAIARLQAADPDGSPLAGSDTAARTAYYAADLARDRRPLGGMATLAVLGIVAWLVGLGLLVARRPAAVAGGIAVAGLAAWAIGLYAV